MKPQGAQELERNANYTIALRNAEAFVRTLNEIRALPETGGQHGS